MQHRQCLVAIALTFLVVNVGAQWGSETPPRHDPVDGECIATTPRRPDRDAPSSGQQQTSWDYPGGYTIDHTGADWHGNSKGNLSGSGGTVTVLYGPIPGEHTPEAFGPHLLDGEWLKMERSFLYVASHRSGPYKRLGTHSMPGGQQPL